MITLSSDFGSPYPAAMKGVISARTDARLVDVSHELPRHDVHSAAFWLREILPYFPSAVHLVVVDPGVGTDRAALVVRAGEHLLVGPDNGVLAPPARRLADGEPVDTFVVDETRSPAPTVPPDATRSRTFHGRDVFAPAAAEIYELGPAALDECDWLERTTEFVSLSLPEPSIGPDRIECAVLAVDDFGNVITNVPGEAVSGWDEVYVEAPETVEGREIVEGPETQRRLPVASTFGEVPVGAPVATVGSHGRLELDVNRGRGDELLGVEPGDRLVLTR